ncbi:MAG: DUF4249 domain-containing protein [Paludibacter sp.]|nr:DUF4249 domain-containing protein [Paludibacter sp.]
MKIQITLLKYRYNVLIIIVVLLLASCTETISIKLDGVSPEIVVEASIPEGANASVKITRTADFNQPNEFSGVTDAIVTLKEANGAYEILSEITPGHYVSSVIKGTPGVKYQLTIMTEDKIISSEDMMPKPVRLNSIRVRELEIPNGPVVDNIIDSPRMEIIVNYTDPQDEVNFYRFIEYVNGKQHGYFLSDDRFNNGKAVRYFMLDFKRILKAGDTLVVEMQSISKSVYNYLYGFSLLNVLPQGTTPSNPVTNINGVELGYFSAFSLHRDTLIIPEL